MRVKHLLLPAAALLLAGVGCVSRPARHGYPPAAGEEAAAESLPLVSAIFGDNMVL